MAWRAQLQDGGERATGTSPPAHYAMPWPWPWPLSRAGRRGSSMAGFLLAIDVTPVRGRRRSQAVSVRRARRPTSAFAWRHRIGKSDAPTIGGVFPESTTVAGLEASTAQGGPTLLAQQRKTRGAGGFTVPPPTEASVARPASARAGGGHQCCEAVSLTQHTTRHQHCALYRAAARCPCPDLSPHCSRVRAAFSHLGRRGVLRGARRRPTCRAHRAALHASVAVPAVAPQPAHGTHATAAGVLSQCCSRSLGVVVVHAARQPTARLTGSLGAACRSSCSRAGAKGASHA
jgi:hypothetical protein